MSSNVLADRDTDTPGQQSGNPFNTKEQGNGGENKPKSMDFHRQMFEKRMNEENGCVTTPRHPQLLNHALAARRMAQAQRKRWITDTVAAIQKAFAVIRISLRRHHEPR